MFMKQTKVWLTLTIALSLLVIASACGKAPDTNESGSTPTTTGEKYTGDVGSVTGAIAYNGAAAGAEEDRHLR